MQRTIVDPQKRNLDISNIVHQKCAWETVDGHLQCTVRRAWLEMQGPNGILSRLKDLGMEYPNGQEIRILTDGEYAASIAATCSIL